MLLHFENFYRKDGIRIADQLMNPPHPKLETMNLPKSSILHFTSVSPLIRGPSADEFLFRNIKRNILIDHVLELGDSKGSPRKMAVSPVPLIRSYLNKHRKFRWAKTLEAGTRDADTLFVYNYGMLPALYKYMRSPYTEYFKWWNLQSAVWKNVGKISVESDRQNFVLCHLPTVLPSLPDLKIGEGNLNQHTVKVFNSPESLMILELWKWFGEQRQDSVLSNIPEKGYDRVNFIFQESGRWFVMNLGIMNSWRAADQNELEINPEASTKGIAPAQFQRRFLRLMMSLFQARSTASPEVTSEAQDGVLPDDTDPELSTVIKVTDTGIDQAKQFDEDEEPVVVTQTTTLPVFDSSTNTARIGIKKVAAPSQVRVRAVRSDRPNDTADDIKHNPEFDKQLMLDLAELENISRRYMEQQLAEPDEEGNVIQHTPQHVPEMMTPVVKEAATLEDGVMSVCNKLAEKGMISAAEYRRYEKLANAYKTLPSPDGTTTLDKYIQVDPQVLKIEESPSIPDISTVVDKTMLKSSLHAFDQRYIKEVMQKDVASMVMNIQHAGMAVTNYEVEKIEDILGAYDAHTVRVTPVDGVSSTLRFKLPRLNEDGTYMANGVKYRMRKQRGDQKILLTGPLVVVIRHKKTYLTAGKSL
jgi:hypothetical protein